MTSLVTLLLVLFSLVFVIESALVLDVHVDRVVHHALAAAQNQITS